MAEEQEAVQEEAEEVQESRDSSEDNWMRLEEMISTTVRKELKGWRPAQESRQSGRSEAKERNKGPLSELFFGKIS